LIQLRHQASASLFLLALGPSRSFLSLLRLQVCLLSLRCQRLLLCQSLLPSLFGGGAILLSLSGCGLRICLRFQSGFSICLRLRSLALRKACVFGLFVLTTASFIHSLLLCEPLIGDSFVANLPQGDQSCVFSTLHGTASHSSDCGAALLAP
jgi:hypothetical protein